MNRGLAKAVEGHRYVTPSLRAAGLSAARVLIKAAVPRIVICNTARGLANNQLCMAPPQLSACDVHSPEAGAEGNRSSCSRAVLVPFQ